jgi:2-phospho-L-lactate/phosphoenolpyruvate guanylyltransferase
MVAGNDGRAFTRDVLHPYEFPPEHQGEEGAQDRDDGEIYGFHGVPPRSTSKRGHCNRSGTVRLAIIPVKPLAHAKERLATALSAEERRALSLAMLADVVAAASVLDEVWVLNSDADAAAVAIEAGAVSKTDPVPDAGLNSSLTIATESASAAGAGGVLVLAADLPSATKIDVDAMVDGPGVLLAPNRSGDGTNALWRSPPRAIDVAFGRGSLSAHERLARAGEIALRLVRRRGLALDVDEPPDLRAAIQLGTGAHTRAILESIGIAERSVAWR